MKNDRPEGNAFSGRTREEWEERIVAVLLGETDVAEAERVRRAVERDPSLAAYRERMQRVIGTVREVHAETDSPAGAPAPSTAMRLSEARRTRLERLWREAPAESAPPRRAINGWGPLALAAGLVLLLGGSAYFAIFREEDPVLAQREEPGAGERTAAEAVAPDREATAPPPDLAMSGSEDDPGRSAFGARERFDEEPPARFAADILFDRSHPAADAFPEPSEAIPAPVFAEPEDAEVFSVSEAPAPERFAGMAEDDAFADAFPVVARDGAEPPESFYSESLRYAGGTALRLAETGFSRIGEVAFLPEGGRLDALDEKGQSIGPVPLKHTDVDVRVSGHFTRVSVTQHYRNPYDHKIEAVYTFPLSHRGAVDRMTMTVGDRVVQGEVKERREARRVYEAARQQGYVTSLLEQERANIFTQSVANIEPGAEVIVEIRYVEVLESVDGEYRFDFPTVVAPRYTPGRPVVDHFADDLPGNVVPRRGVVLPAPATIEGNGTPVPDDPWLRQNAVPIDRDSPIIDFERRGREDPRVVFTAEYESGEREYGLIFADGVGRIGPRWFFCPPRVLPEPGEPFAAPTDEVPDADRVTPMPVRPDQRAGHDLDIRVSIDTGGPEITRIRSSSHEIERAEAGEEASSARANVALADGPSIPNRDFRLAWSLESDDIEEAFLTHTGGYGDFEGGFFTLILQPPERVADENVRPRELIFVLDQSGSMSGAGLADRSALDAAKEVIGRSIDTMRSNDRFNIVSFNHTLDVLWERPRENTAENRAHARRYIDSRQGGGGTEMRNALLRALGAHPFERPRRDPDAEGDDPMRIVLFVTDGLVGNDDAIIRAVRDHAHETRVFAIGMSQAPNRHLLDGMARAGRGAVDYVLPEDDVEPVVQRFADRIATPVLTDIELDFGEGLEVIDVLPSPEHMPDLFDVEPLVIHGRYTAPGQGALILRGRTGAGPYQRSLDIVLPEVEPGHDVIATLWAREKVGELMREGGDDVRSIVRLGESFQIVTRQTSFVAVERRRVTVGGEPVLVRVPIEFPKGMSWEGIFGKTLPDDELVRQGRERRAFDDLDASHLGTDRASLYYGVPARQSLTGSVAGESMHRRGAAAVAEGRPEDSPYAAFRQPEPEPSRVAALRPELPAEGERRDISRARSASTAWYSATLPDGVRLVALSLPRENPEDRLSRLRELLHGGEDASEALVRVVHDETANAVLLFVPEPFGDVFEGFAEKIGVDKDVAEEDLSAEWEAMLAGIESRIADLRRDAVLYRRIDDTLYDRVLAARRGEDRGTVELSVLLSDLGTETLASLERAGLDRKATAADASFVVGSVSMDRLETLALLDSVRRIEAVSR